VGGGLDERNEPPPQLRPRIDQDKAVRQANASALETAWDYWHTTCGQETMKNKFMLESGPTKTTKLISVCAWCHPHAKGNNLTHTICPECAEKMRKQYLRERANLTFDFLKD